MQLLGYYLSPMLKNKRNRFIYKNAVVLKSFKEPWMTTIIIKKKGCWENM